MFSKNNCNNNNNNYNDDKNFKYTLLDNNNNLQNNNILDLSDEDDTSSSSGGGGGNGIIITNVLDHNQEEEDDNCNIKIKIENESINSEYQPSNNKQDNNNPNSSNNSKKSFLKEILIVSTILGLVTLYILLYNLFIPTVFMRYVELTHPEYSKDEINSKASSYKSLSDALPNLTLFLFGPAIGYLSDKYGRKKILILVAFVSFIDVTSCLITYLTNKLFYFYIGHCICGINGVAFSCVLSYLSDLTPKEERPKVFSKMGIAIGMGVVLGPISGVLLAKTGPLFSLYGAYAFLGIAMILIFFLPESNGYVEGVWTPRVEKVKRSINPFKSIIKLFSTSKYIGFVALIFVSFAFTSEDVMTTLFIYTNTRYSWGSTQNGLYIGGIGVVVIIWTGVVTPLLLKRFSDRKIVSFALVVSFCTHIGNAFSVNQWMWIAFGIPGSFSMVIMNLVQSIISKSTPPEFLGSVLVGVASVSALSQFGGALVSQNVFAYFISSKAPFYLPGAHLLLSSIIIFITFLGSLLIWKKYPNQFPLERNKKNNPESMSKPLLINSDEH
eukprot:gene8436-10362_t